MFAVGRHIEQADAIQVYYRRGSGGKNPQSLGNFRSFLKKNNNFYHNLGSRFKRFFRPSERTKFAEIRNLLEILKLPIPF